MKYDITKRTSPKMPTLGKGTECLQILLSQVSKSMHEPLVPMLFPVLGAQVSDAEFQYPDLTWKELCGQMANLVAESGGNKGQLSYLVEAICRSSRAHDEEELKKLVEWQRQMKTKGANKDKPARRESAEVWRTALHHRRRVRLLGYALQRSQSHRHTVSHFAQQEGHRAIVNYQFSIVN